MRYMIVLGLLALCVSAFSASDDDTASVKITLDDYITVAFDGSLVMANQAGNLGNSINAASTNPEVVWDDEDDWFGGDTVSITVTSNDACTLTGEVYSSLGDGYLKDGGTEGIEARVRVDADSWSIPANHDGAGGAATPSSRTFAWSTSGTFSTTMGVRVGRDGTADKATTYSGILKVTATTL